MHKHKAVSIFSVKNTRSPWTVFYDTTPTSLYFFGKKLFLLLKYKTENLKRNKKLSENARLCAIHSNFNSDFNWHCFFHLHPEHFKYLRQKVQPPKLWRVLKLTYCMITCTVFPPSLSFLLVKAVHALDQSTPANKCEVVNACLTQHGCSTENISCSWSDWVFLTDFQRRLGINVMLPLSPFSRKQSWWEVVIYSKLGFVNWVLNYTIRGSRDQS